MKKAIIDFTTHLFIDKVLFIEIKWIKNNENLFKVQIWKLKSILFFIRMLISRNYIDLEEINYVDLKEIKRQK